MFNRLKSLTHLIGSVVITLTALYGGLAFFGGDALVNAALGDLELGLASDSTAPANTPAAIPVPSAFNYRGTLRDGDGNLVTSGEYTLTFKIYDTIGATEALFSQTQGGIIVRNGAFNTTIDGIPTATFTASADRFIGVTIEPFSEMVPRERLASVPYAVQAAQAFNGVPVGGVVDWWRPNTSIPMPDGYQLCDGSTVTDPLSPYLGSTTPNLQGQVIRGANPGEELGTGGTSANTVNFASIDSHNGGVKTTSAAGGHGHSISGWSGGLTIGAPHPGNYNYQILDDVHGWSSNGHIAVWPGAASTQGYEGNHFHEAGNLSAAGVGDHSHNVDIGTLNHSGSQFLDNMPPYTNLLKICRIR